MKPNLINKLTRTSHKVAFKIKKHSPEILVITGTVGVIASTVLACKATTKLDGILKEMNAKSNAIHKLIEQPETLPEGTEYTVEDSKKDLTIIYAQTAVAVAKLYAPSVILGTVSIVSILASHNIMRKRNMAISAALGACMNEFKEYRGRVVERFGKEIDRQLKFNIKPQDIETVVVDENGNETTVTETVDMIDEKQLNEYSEFAKFFDCGNPFWQKSPEDNLWFLKQQERWANDKLQRDGYLFLNDVYEAIGIPKTKAGQVCGWVYDKDGAEGVDNYVDFGIFDRRSTAARQFVNGTEPTILLDFNVDGNIWEQM